MLQEASRNRWQKFLPALIGAVVVAAIVGFPSGRELLGRFFRSLRMQKVQAVNVNLSAFTDPNANPALHQMIAQMIGASRETVSRALSEFEDAGWIGVERRRITVRDRGALEARARLAVA